jgi:hypothetical protein
MRRAGTPDDRDQMSTAPASSQPQVRPLFMARVFYGFLALAGFSAAISMAGEWIGNRIALAGHSDSTAIHEIVIGNNVLSVPENMIRFEEARRSGVANRLDLYMRWPELKGYREAVRDDFNHADGARNIIFVSFQKRLMSRDMSRRYFPIYASLVDREARPGPDGIDIRPFLPSAGYLDEILAVGWEGGSIDPFVARRPIRSARACAPARAAAPRSMRETGTISRPFFTLSGNVRQILHVLLGDQHLLDAAAKRREQLLLQAADRQHAPAQRDLAGHRDIARTGMPVSTETIAVAMAMPADGPSLGVAPSGTWTWMSRLSKTAARCRNRSPRADVGRRRRDRFLHHVAQVAGDRHRPLPGIMTPSIVSSSPPTSVQARPVTTPTMILELGLAVAELRHAEIVGQVVGGDRPDFLPW